MLKNTIVQQKIDRINSIWTQYEKYIPAAAFIGGFLFDIVTLDRIDSLFGMIQQGLYLILSALILVQMFVEQAFEKSLSEKWKIYTEWRLTILHFIFGSLLSSYTLFYFLSASSMTSFLFILIIAALLVANELPRFQGLGLGIKFALFFLCIYSYSAYLVPTLFGKIGALVFFVSLSVGSIPLYGIYHFCQKLKMDPLKIRTQMLRPSIAVLMVFALSYLLKIIPPVPLSLQYVGIYHSIEKNDSGQFLAYHERPWWRFWQNGDQSFVAQPGDKIVAFFRLFSPSGFKENVKVVWSLHLPKHGWQVQDKIPIEISGGRDKGFRGYASKANFTSGKWRVALETNDGREIGRLGFEVSTAPTSPREWNTDQF